MVRVAPLSVTALSCHGPSLAHGVGCASCLRQEQRRQTHRPAVRQCLRLFWAMSCTATTVPLPDREVNTPMANHVELLAGFQGADVASSELAGEQKYVATLYARLDELR